MIPEVYEREYLRPFCEFVACLLGGRVQWVEYDPDTDTCKAEMTMDCLKPVDSIQLHFTVECPDDMPRKPGAGS